MRPDVWVALPTGEAAGVAPLGGLQLVFALCRPPCQPPRAAAHVGGVGLWRPVWALCLECGAGRALSSRSRLSWLGEARAGLRSQSAGSSVPAPTGSAALWLCGSGPYPEDGPRCVAGSFFPPALGGRNGKILLASMQLSVIRDFLSEDLVTN